MKKKIIFDTLFNILATMIPTLALQFIILPQIALNINADSYGQLLAVIAYIYLFSSTFGNVLNNSKLIHYKKYEDLKINGDFNIFLVIFLIMNFIIIVVGLFYYGTTLTKLTNLLLVLMSGMLLFTAYTSVEFRIKLNFKKIFINSIMLFLGYLIGYSVFLLTGNWSFVYLCGIGFSMIYLCYSTNIWRGEYNKTFLFKKTFKEVIILLASGILVSIGAYVDKLLIYPVLGGAAVSIYYVATILGKTIGLIVGPITGVFLSYLAQMKTFKSNNFKILLLSSSVLGFVCYWIIIILSKPIISIVYPQYVESAMHYVPITTLSTIVTIVANIINAIILKFSSAKWQVYINLLYMAVYLPLSLYLLTLYGLMGFCIGILIASFVKLVSTIATYFYHDRLNNNKI